MPQCGGHIAAFHSVVLRHPLEKRVRHGNFCASRRFHGAPFEIVAPRYHEGYFVNMWFDPNHIATMITIIVEHNSEILMDGR